MNPSFILALIVSAIVSTIIGLPLQHLLFGGPLPIGFAFSAMLTAIYMIWVYHNTPTKNRSAARWFNSQLVRVGPDGKGFVEGLNALPFGWPIMTAEDKYAGETTENFSQMTAFSKDRMEVALDGTYNVYMDDIYLTYNIKNPLDSVKSTVLKQVRNAAENHNIEEIISEEVEGRKTVKTLMAETAYTRASTELASTKCPWGYNITPALQVTHIRPPQALVDAWRRERQEVVEGRYEMTQVNRRVSQIKQLKDAGVNPDLAAAVAQVEAEKPGVRINTLNFPGSQGLGEGIGRLSEVARDWLLGQAKDTGEK